MAEQPDGLMQVLLDGEAEFGDRHDAAMDLSAFDGEAVEKALASVACDQSADEDLADACGESLAEIWCRRNSLSEGVVVKLVPASLRIALATLRACSPALATEAEFLISTKKPPATL